MLKEGEKIKIGRRTGIIYYVNKRLECYQVIFDSDYQELVPFHKVETQKSHLVGSS